MIYYLLSGSTAATAPSVVAADAGPPAAPSVVARATFVLHLHGDNRKISKKHFMVIHRQPQAALRWRVMLR